MVNMFGASVRNILTWKVHIQPTFSHHFVTP